MAVSSVEITELRKIQADVLLEDTSLNTNMKSSPIPQINKALNTPSKKVVMAMNDMYAEISRLSTETKNVLNSLSNALGDYENGLGGEKITDIINALSQRLTDVEENGGGSGTGGPAVKGYRLYNYNERLLGQKVFDIPEYTEEDSILVYVEGIKIAENAVGAPITFTRLDSTSIQFNESPASQLNIEIYVM